MKCTIFMSIFLLLSQVNIAHAETKNHKYNNPKEVAQFCLKSESDPYALAECTFKVAKNDKVAHEAVDFIVLYYQSVNDAIFLLKAERIIIEIKKTREGLKDKKLGEELTLDIQKYQAHPDCETLVCFVYDPEARIDNPRGLEKDLEHRSIVDFRVLLILSLYSIKLLISCYSFKMHISAVSSARMFFLLQN